jgi:hypothetical protein
VVNDSLNPDILLLDLIAIREPNDNSSAMILVGTAVPYGYLRY